MLSFRLHVPDDDPLLVDQLPQEVVADVYVPGSRRAQRVVRELDCPLVVLEDLNSLRGSARMHESKHPLHKYRLLNSVSHTNVFRFGGGHCYATLNF